MRVEMGRLTHSAKQAMETAGHGKSGESTREKERERARKEREGALWSIVAACVEYDVCALCMRKGRANEYRRGGAEWFLLSSLLERTQCEHQC